MSIHYSPLRYPGGKNCIFPFVANLFYENNLIGINYAEPYAGGAGWALRLLYEGYVEHIYLNDLDKSVYAFWFSILNYTDEFCKWIEGVEISVENWNKLKEVQRDSNNVDILTLAKSTFFLNRTNISGVIKGGIIGGQSQNGNFKINARFKKDDLVERIEKIAMLKNRITISNLDGLTFLSKLNKKREYIFFYLDPPYLQKGADLYMNFYSKVDHKKLFKYVSKMNRKWMVSYDNHSFILNLYSNKNKIRYKLSQSASNRIDDEILIFSDDIYFKESISKLSSPVII